MNLRKVNLFTQHSRHWRDNVYVYPVISRRSDGLSIGVNLNPDTACNFDCIYCCVDRTVPPRTREVDLSIVRSELEQMLDLATSGELFNQPPFDQTPQPLRRLNDVAFSGDGEPTAYPQFAQACRLVAEVLDLRKLDAVKMVLITNATLLARPGVEEGLAVMDRRASEIWAKLDAGTEEYYQQVERTAVPLARVMENIAAAARRRAVVIQSLFMNINGQPPPQSELSAYIGRLYDLRQAGAQIRLVQVYTIARKTAEVNVTPLDDQKLDAIAAQVQRLGLNVRTFHGPA